MITIHQWITALAVMLARFGLCCAAGILVGMLAGCLLMLAYCGGAQGALFAPQIIEAGLLVAVPGFLMLAWILILLLRYPAASVLPGIVLNAALTGILTVATVSYLNAWGFAVLLGMLVGAIVGRLLCLLRACPGEDRHGLQ